ncbi:MAG TPA: Mov34/MPN/PAD-1 family protein [Terriglobales bacterium]|nr:Mov34/MPN/PAD-1 family protein [Terriglobales bacterium]
MTKPKRDAEQLAVLIDSEVARKIRQHARSSSKTEVCGVLIGTDHARTTEIQAAITGLNAAQAGTHVTFTQDTWEHIYKTKDRDYPNQRIVGWYHSHPGFGVFLSDHDTFIHKNFFSSPKQVAWVYDPHSDEEGCFGWVGDRIERLSAIAISDRKGGEEAGETGKPEPVGAVQENDLEELESSPHEKHSEPAAWLRRTVAIASHLSVLAVGFLASWFLFPQTILLPVPVDPQTGHPLLQFMPEELRERIRMMPSINPLTDGSPDPNRNEHPATAAASKDKNGSK